MNNCRLILGIQLTLHPLSAGVALTQQSNAHHNSCFLAWTTRRRRPRGRGSRASCCVAKPAAALTAPRPALPLFDCQRPVPVWTTCLGGRIVLVSTSGDMQEGIFTRVDSPLIDPHSNTPPRQSAQITPIHGLFPAADSSPHPAPRASPPFDFRISISPSVQPLKPKRVHSRGVIISSPTYLIIASLLAQ